MNHAIKTAECVTPKHPDKMCDQISDAILDLFLSKDPNARVAVETMGGHGRVYIVGEVTSKNDDDVTIKVIRDIAKRIVGKDIYVEINIKDQSSEIAQGVDTGGAGDQGIMIGFACNDNDGMIPNELFYARSLAKYLYEKFPYDGKTQVTMNEDDDIVTIVASFQNVEGVKLKMEVESWIEMTGAQCTPEVQIFANPAGDWNIGGFDADTGLTGRKLVVDNYGPQIAIGGGCFSGKDASKVDRSAAYMARKIAVDVLKTDEDFSKVMVKLAYAIGVAHPVMVTCDVITKGGERLFIDVASQNKYDLTPKGIREFLKLNAPQYEETARWGHFGNGFAWDK